ncbi:thioredoxin domain-containing protein [Candidatus Kuenenia sp.]|uniref:thioredoxin domain-containing protein n=1 Tax=Candidatus Kuenenia sp. TaxID=2499824 RepID=UPI0032205D8E
MKTNKPNHLINEKSPYLQQHAYNPVDWYPWGKEAFEKAKAESKAIFLSIGYSTCHWCHVMETESFEDEEVAKILNEYYVAIKVDREERPDIDNVYMTVCQAMTGSGGWPLTLFLTPEGKPFYAGTYFPKTERFGNPGLIALLTQIANLWNTNKESIIASSLQVTKLIDTETSSKGEETPDVRTLKTAYEQLRDRFDSLYGGFGTSPKFPTPHNFTFLLRWWKRSNNAFALEMVEKSLELMARGGIHDHLGGGFHRYSTDEYWLTPHFEKMLYDQALLAIAYIETHQATKKDLYSAIAKDVFDYVLRDMTSPEGGFYSAEDADSEGIEGKFYVWKPEEIKEALGEKEGNIFCDFYDVSDIGNFEDKNILHADKPLHIAAKLENMPPDALEKLLANSRKKLLSIREKRIKPQKDTKIITSWNGLMISALSRGAQAMDEPKYANAAMRAADFILNTLLQENKILLRRYCEGEAAIAGFLDDYAFFVNGLIDLYEATFQEKYLQAALQMNEEMIKNFLDENEGGFFLNGKANEKLFTQTKDIYDGATPSGNSIALLNLLRLGRITGNPSYEALADNLIKAFSGAIIQNPSGYTQFMCALDFALGPAKEIIVAGEREGNDTKDIFREIGRRFLPNKVLLLHPTNGIFIEEIAPYTKELTPIEGRVTVYVCENYSCKKPVSDKNSVIQLLE